jgi:rhodanese-related sulfurtransferase
LKGSINVGVDGKYATWAGTVLHKEAPIVVVADDERLAESIMRLGRIGFDHVAGYLDGGMEALHDHPDLIGQVERVAPAAVPELEPKPHVLDVRTEKEWNGGHLEGSQNIPLSQLADRISEVPGDGTLVVHCAGGYRSSIAASLLLKHGRENVLDMVGGYKAWEQSKLPVEQSEGAATCEGSSCSA